MNSFFLSTLSLSHTEVGFCTRVIRRKKASHDGDLKLGFFTTCFFFGCLMQGFAGSGAPFNCF